MIVKCHSFKAEERPSFSEILFLLPSLNQSFDSESLESSSDSGSYCEAYKL